MRRLFIFFILFIHFIGFTQNSSSVPTYTRIIPPLQTDLKSSSIIFKSSNDFLQVHFPSIRSSEYSIFPTNDFVVILADMKLSSNGEIYSLELDPSFFIYKQTGNEFDSLTVSNIRKDKVLSADYIEKISIPTHHNLNKIEPQLLTFDIHYN
ncbi:hypothetical protein C7S20_02545 [Christiangramia fulva]|uniref:Uncharacterized protein n=1 Tax=Christiangramia fulva TaxID=2126553 RepID=A0A2R3Z1R6_9FLAO|nr:hypothetical protein [Christiangramia fulva]AVR44230.1 hypothetical protein C7S20_02545 [Christiangramia fulva]